MRKCTVFAVVIELVFCLAPTYAETLVYLLGGQSNMYGLGATAELSPPLSNPQEDVRYWNNGWVDLRPGLLQPIYFGPEVSFGRAMADAKPTDEIYLVKYAAGGTNLAQQWAPPNGPQYTTFKNTVVAALESLDQAEIDYRIAGMLWMQGESDALNSSHADAYETNLANFIEQVRSDVRVPEMPFVLGRVLSVFDTTPPGGAAVVRSAQQAAAEQDDNVYWFSTDDLSVGVGDPGHYTAQGQVDMGYRFAEVLDDLAIPDPPYHAFDLNLDGTFDVYDWLDVLQPNLSRDLSSTGVTPAKSYLYGDFDGNLRVDLEDFRHFKEAFESEYGTGSLAAATLSVPEPPAIAIAVVATALVVGAWK